MRLQLSSAQVAFFCDEIQKDAPDNGFDFAVSVCRAFQRHGHEPFTRRDMTAIKKAYPHAVEAKPSLKEGLASLALRSFEGRAGYYQIPRGPAKAPPKKLLLREEGTTRAFIEEGLKRGLDRVVAGRVLKKNPHMDYDEVLSEVHEWFAYWAKMGTCDPYLKKGAPPSAGVLAFWANQKIRRSTYKQALDPVNRELRGFRTQREIENRKDNGGKDYLTPGAETLDPTSAVRVSWKISSEGEKPEPVFGIEPEEVSQEELSKRDLVARVLDLCHPTTKGVYSQVWKKSYDGESVQDIAQSLACNESQAHELRKQVRASVKTRVAPVIQTAQKILKLLEQEPFSTHEEIREEAGKQADTALGFLIGENLVKKVPGNCYQNTDMGATAVSQGLTLV